MMKPKPVEAGTRFGRLVVIAESERKTFPNGSSHRMLRLLCDCGKEICANLYHVKSGHTVSCGCERLGALKKAWQVNKKHGHSRRDSNGERKPTSEFTTWQMMKDRCFNRNSTSFKYYGARGISVCDRWCNSFENFLADMGPKPAGLTLDRINNDGNYEPANCRWATAKEQVDNRRSMQRSANGQFQPLG